MAHYLLQTLDNLEKCQTPTPKCRCSVSRTSSTNRDARQDFEYDNGDRLLSIERQLTGIGRQLGITEEELEYTYDLLGRLTKEISPDGTL
ncbi:hypothetical protein ACF8GF_01880, partial [Pseudomonas sp. yb_5]